MGISAKYIAVNSSQLSELLTEGERVADSFIAKLHYDNCVHGSGSNTEDELLKEAIRRGQSIWIEFDKNFRELHWLLCDKEFPGDSDDTANENNLLSVSMFSASFVPGRTNTGYGPVRYVEISMVKRIADLFSTTQLQDLARAHSIDLEDNESLEWRFNAFKDFYTRAAESNYAVLQTFG